MKNKIVFGVGLIVGFVGFTSVSAYTVIITPIPYHPEESVGKTTVIWVSDPVKVEKALREYEKETNKEINTIVGLAEFTNKKCTIYAEAPKNMGDSEAFETLGHEMLHCFSGSYHD